LGKIIGDLHNILIEEGIVSTAEDAKKRIFLLSAERAESKKGLFLFACLSQANKKKLLSVSFASRTSHAPGVASGR
jgi:hypothetical protein